LHLEWRASLQLRALLRPLQVRKHEEWLLHYLHQRRRQVLRYAASLLRLPRNVLQERLLLLCLLRQHLLLLRHLRRVVPALKEGRQTIAQARKRLCAIFCAGK
jgi:hypothetical protein